MSEQQKQHEDGDKGGEEEECIQQRTARERLDGMREEMARLRLMQAQGLAPPSDDPVEAHIEQGILREMERLEREVARPLSRRIPVGATPPREILRRGTKLVLLDDPAPVAAQLRERQGVDTGCLSVFRTLLQNQNYRMVCCFSITFRCGFKYGESFQETEIVQVGYLPWSRDMNAWTPQQWAWFLAVVLKRTQWQVGSFFLQYKLQDIPQDDFPLLVGDAFTDITYTERYASSLERYRDVHIKKATHVDELSIDVDKLSDCAWAFDTTLWECACEYGLEVEDRSTSPALTFLCGELGHKVVDKTGKRWNSQTEYVRARLDSAKVSDSLSTEEAEMHKDFIMDIMDSTKFKEINADDNPLEVADMLRKFFERKLAKRLRRVARAYNMTIPEEAEVLNQRRCDNCNSAEGTKRDDNGNVITKFLSCPCNPGGRPFYCNESCRHSDWPVHKEFCTIPQEKSKSKPKSSSKSSKGKTKKKKSKK